MNFDVDVPELKIEANSSAQNNKNMPSQYQRKTKVIPETQDVRNAQTVLETQIGTIVLD